MYRIENIRTEPCEASAFVNVERMHYTQDGVSKSWDIARVHDSVAVLLYHRDRDAFILVKQFRPPVYLANDDGFTYELCAGIVDKSKPLEVIASEEILEECGYEVAASKLERVTSFYTAVGFAGARQTLYFAEVDDSMQRHEGGGIETEAIEVVYLPAEAAKAFIFDESRAKTPGIMFALTWFFEDRE